MSQPVTSRGAGQPWRRFGTIVLLAGLVAWPFVPRATADVALEGPSRTSGERTVAVDETPSFVFFERNRGQATGEVDYVARTGSYVAGLDAGGLLMAGTGGRVGVRIVGAAASAVSVPGTELGGVSHYLLGRDEGAWVRGVRHHAGVVYRGVRPGVDASYRGRDGRVELVLDVRPGADPADLRLSLQGLPTPQLLGGGGLNATGEMGSLALSAPVAWQEIGGARSDVDVRYRIDDRGDVAFVLGPYDVAHTVRIDPVIAYGSAFGDSLFDSAGDVGRDGDEHIRIVGRTISPEFEVSTGTSVTDLREADDVGSLFSLRLDPHAERILTATFISGSSPAGLASSYIASSGEVTCYGSTAATDFPVTEGAHRTTLPGDFAAYVVRIAADGAGLVYGTYLDGAGGGFALDVNDEGEAVAAVQRGGEEKWSSHAVFLSADGSQVLREIELVRDPGEDVYVHDIALDGQGALHVCGRTHWTGLPLTEGALQTVWGGGGSDGWVAKYDAAGTLVYQTLLGGESDDWMWRIAADAAGSAYLLGRTRSEDFPRVAAFSTDDGSDWDTTLSKLAPDGGSLVFSTYLAGRKEDLGESIALDDAGNVFVCGTTDSDDFPTHDWFRDPPPPTADPLGQGWAATFTTSGAVVWSSYLGNSVRPRAIAPGNTCGDVLLAGQTNQLADFPLRLPFQEGIDPAPDAFLIVLQDEDPAFEIQQTVLDPCTETAQVRVSLSTCCGARPFNWRVISGSLFVTGSLDSATGEIVGTAREAGDYRFTVRVTDGFGRETQQNIAVIVNRLPEIVDPAPPAAPIGRPLDVDYDVSGGSAPHAWSVDSGDFPVGLSLDAGTGRLTGAATGGEGHPTMLRCTDDCDIASVREVDLPPAAFLALDGSQKKVEVAAAPNESGAPRAWFVEALSGSRLQVAMKGVAKGTLLARLELLDNEGNRLALADPGFRRTAKIKNADVTRTGRYFLRLDPVDGFTGNARLATKVKAKTTWKLGAVLEASGTSEVGFAALAGAKLTVSVVPAKRSKARPTIASIRAADGTELLDPTRLKERSKTASVKAGQLSQGGDFVVRVTDRGTVGGAVVVKVRLKGKRTYTFTLPELVTGSSE